LLIQQFVTNQGAIGSATGGTTTGGSTGGAGGFGGGGGHAPFSLYSAIVLSEALTVPFLQVGLPPTISQSDLQLINFQHSIVLESILKSFPGS
jgi:hypothetical protein